MKIGILEAGHPPDSLRKDFGSYGEMFIALLDGYNFSFQLYDVENMKFPNSINEADGWLITGSKHGVYEAHQFIKPLEIFIQKIYAKNIPLVGICFGHQLIIQAVNGLVEKYSEGWSTGIKPVKFNIRKPWLPKFHDQIRLISFHQDQVIKIPNFVEHLAETDFCKYYALSIDDYIFTIQGHPEFSNTYALDLLEIKRECIGLRFRI